MPMIFQRSEKLRQLWKATHEFLNDTKENSAAEIDDVLDSSSSGCSDNFWNELEASDSESTGQ